jgi:predicted permease
MTLDLLGHDIRFACRALARQPALALIAVGSLGAAMAAAIAVFGLANAILFDKLPVPEPDRLVVLRWVSGPRPPYESLDGWSSSNERESTSTSFAYAGFQAAREDARGRADLFGFADLYRVHVGTGAEPPQIATGQVVSGNYYSALGLRPALGRFITPDDDHPGAEPVAVVSHAFWTARLGARPDVSGLVLRINGVPTTVVGVAPRGFNGTRQVSQTSDVSVPLALRDRFVRQPGDQRPQADPQWWWVIMMARLSAGVEPPAVQPAIEAAIERTFAAEKDAAGRFRVQLLDGSRGMPEERATLVEPLTIMAAIVALVVLIACTNLANLLLARGASRDREVALRLALGASRGHIVRQLLVESIIIGLLAAAVGVAAATWLATGLLPALQLESEGLGLTTNGRVVAFAAVAALVCAVLFGLAPAWRGSDVQPVRINRVPRLRLARVLLVAQVALSVVILVAAGLLWRTLQNLEHVTPGFEARGMLTFRVDPTLNGYDEGRIRSLYTTLLERLRALPGVARASFSHHGLLYGWSSRSSIETLEGRKLPRDIDINRLIVDKDFFDTVGIPLVAGRNFTGLEQASGLRQVVINREFARTGFNTNAPMGRQFQLSTQPDAPKYEIIGVVGDARIVRLKDPAPPTVYFSYTQEITYAVVFALRTKVPPETLADAVRTTVAAVDPDLPVARLRTQEAQLAASLLRERLFARLAAALAALALALACIGLYGLMAYAVSRRTPEIGIRMALGAARGRVLRMIVADACRLMIAGLAIGVGAAIAAGRYLENQLFGLTPSDPSTQALAVALLAIVSLAAAYLPARRASRVDPLIALKSE